MKDLNTTRHTINETPNQELKQQNQRKDKVIINQTKHMISTLYFSKNDIEGWA